MIDSLYKKIAPVGRVPIPLAIKSQVFLARYYEIPLKYIKKTFNVKLFAIVYGGDFSFFVSGNSSLVLFFELTA